MTDSVAIAHWNQTLNGGAERVAWELARQFDAPLYVGKRDASIEPDDVNAIELHDGILGKMTELGPLPQIVAEQFAWEVAEPIREYDVLITSGNEPLAYVPPADQTWVHYCHHTSRWASDLLPHFDRKRSGRLAPLMNAAERVVRKCERVVYRGYASKPDMLITNSEPVASRIHRYWGQSRHRTTVVYPPVSCDEYGPDIAETGDYYLSLSRLGLHKGVPEIAEDFCDVDRELRIAGDGEKRGEVEAAAAGHENIDVLGYVSEQRKRELLAGAKALIVNSVHEDFGINAAEALASGTPIIGVREGMTQYLARDGVTGITFERGSLPSAIGRFERDGVALAEREIAACADQFGADRFGAEMRQAVKAARERSSVEPAFRPPAETEDHGVEVDLRE